MSGIRTYDGPRRTDWNTPRAIFDALDAEFRFCEFDPCPALGNLDELRTDGLTSLWPQETVFLNPPYSNVGVWVEKAYRESQRGVTVVALLPVRTDTRWWHNYVMRAEEVRFSVDRIWFERSDGRSARAPFGSCVVVWRPRAQRKGGVPTIESWILPERAGKGSRATRHPL